MKRFFLYIQTIIISCAIVFTGCGDEIFDLAERANDGIVMGAALVKDSSGIPYVILTDGEDYTRTITVDGMGEPFGGEQICLDPKGRIHIIELTPSIFSYSREESQWYTSAGDYTDIASGESEIFATFNGGSYYLYRFDSDSGNQWVDTGCNVSGFSDVYIARDPATGNVFVADYFSSDVDLYRVTDLTSFATTSGLPGSPTCFAMYNNVAYYIAGDYLYSSITTGQMNSTALGSINGLIVVDSGTIFALVFGANAGIYRFDYTISDWTVVYTFPVTNGSLVAAAMNNGKLLIGMWGASPAEYNGLYVFDYTTNTMVKEISDLYTYAVTSNR